MGPRSSSPRSRTIKVDYLARVEGEGSLEIRMRRGAVERVAFTIFEPPRLFESILRGRAFTEAPDVTARICGICPVAYQMSACQAMESAVGVTVTPEIRALRRLLYCGEWIESHALHVFMLHAPDFLGYEDAIAMAKEHPEVVGRGLRMKRAGNALLEAIGGRAIHPVNVRVGGFHRAPDDVRLEALLPELRWGRDAARDAVRWLGTLRMPELARDYTFVGLRHPQEYPICEGRLVSSRGLDIPVAEYETRFAEHQVPHSTALHALLDGGSYLCGPLARFNLNADRLPSSARALAAEVGLEAPCRNPFKSILVRGVELFWAFDEAIRLLEAYVPPDPPHVETPAREGVGHGCTEAPRGILYHRYAIDAAGRILQARIVPPTSQNQRTIEEDLAAIAPALAAMPLEAATLRAEQAVRNHDPCISCSTHFLRLRVVEGEDRGGQLPAPPGEGAAAPWRVAGVGSAVGDDAVGLRVIDELERRALPPGVELHRVVDPSLLVDLLGAGGPLLVVDAVHDPSSRPGTVVVRAAGELGSAAEAPSTHALSVSRAFALARALHGEDALRGVHVVGITTSCTGPEATLDEPSAVAEAVRRVLEAIAPP